MTTSRWAALGAAIALAAIAFWYLAGRSAVSNEIDLIATLPAAEKRTNVVGQPQFVIESVTVDGVAKRVILARPHSRLIYPVLVPRMRGWRSALRSSPRRGICPATARNSASGSPTVASTMSCSGSTSTPSAATVAGSRSVWICRPTKGGRSRSIFNTDPGPPEGRDVANDLAVWAEPRIYSKR